MTTYKDQYKTNNGFGDIKTNRAFNKKICEIKRKEQRAENFAKRRELENLTNAATNTDDKDNKCYKLFKWKAERDRRKKMEQLKKKPAFKVGIVRHNYYSPPIKDSIILSSTKQCLNGHKQVTRSATPSKRITRATEKRLLQKSMAANRIPQIQNVAGKKQDILTGKETDKNSAKNKKSLAPSNYKFTAPSGVTKMSLFGHESMLQTPVKAVKSVDKENTVEVFLSKIKSGLFHQEDDIEDTNVRVKTSDINTRNESIEGITLNVSCDEHEMTFHDNVKKGEFLQSSNISNNNNLPIKSPPNTSLITAEKKTITENTPKNIDTKQATLTPPLGNIPLLSKDINSNEDPVFFSPYIVSSRGKSNARKEQQIRRGINCSPSENIPTKDTVMKTLNISIEEEERTAQYFSFMLNKERARLIDLCKKWTEIQSELGITEDAQYQINQAVGQTNLLINKKFERFRGLVLDCATGKGEMLVTCRDLQGFWDMMYMEVTNCDSRFKKLEELRSNGWNEEEIAVRKIMPNKKVRPKKKVISKSKSSVQNFMLAAKKKMKNKTDNLEVLKNQLNESINKLSTSINDIDIVQNKSDVFRKNDIRQLVPINSDDRLCFPAKKTDSRHSLLQKTLLSESCKNETTPMTIMQINKMCQTPKIELDDSILYINCKQTPSKSILKRTDKSTINKTRYTKSAQKVNFNDHVILKEVSIDEESQNNFDLAARLAKIDNCDLDAEYENYSIRAEKKLNFDDSFLDSEYNLQCNTEQLNLSDITKIKELGGNTSSKSEDMPLKESTNKCRQNETNIKVLRNRVVITDNSTRTSTARRSGKGVTNEDKDNQKENETPALRRSLRLFKQKESIRKTKSLNETPVNIRKNLRRSSRKSVQFNVTTDEYRVSTGFTPTHQVTPHTRRSKRNFDLSYLKNNSPIQLSSPNTNLISWDSPKILSRRSSRSSNKRFF